MNILKYNGHTETEIYTLIKKVRNNDYESLEKLNLIFKDKIYIKNNPNYDAELTSFFYELLLKIPLDNILQKHKLINYLLSSFKKKKSQIFKNQSIQINKSNNLSTNLTSNISFSVIDELVTLKTSLSTLSLDEKQLLSLYYKYGYTEKEIGSYFNNITKMAISKRKKKILEKLKENF